MRCFADRQTHEYTVVGKNIFTCRHLSAEGKYILFCAGFVTNITLEKESATQHPSHLSIATHTETQVYFRTAWNNTGSYGQKNKQTAISL